MRCPVIHSLSEMVMTERLDITKSWSRFAGCICVGCCALLSIVGCGDSGSNNVTQEVSADAPAVKPETDPTENSPGELVMPEGLDKQTAGADQNSSGASAVSDVGLEMPNLSSDDLESKERSSQPLGESLRYGSWDEIQQEILRGEKITVVDLWSLACEPCLKEFPGLVQLHRDYSEQINCVSVNLDFDGRKTRPPESYESEVVAFLQSVQAEKLTSYICSTSSDDVFIEEKIPSIPVVMVFNAQGKLVKRFIDAGETVGFSYAESVRPAVIELLEKK